jgi:predicted DNA-binding WGR domain protein
MSTAGNPKNAEEQGADYVFRYGGPSEVRPEQDGSRLSLVGNDTRGDVRALGTIKDSLRFREALSVMYAVVGSDYRYVPKDRTAYLAYLRQQQAAPKKSVWDAQKSYFDWIQRNDPAASLILDPVISVQPDGLFFEVFSKDESTYARLQMDWDCVDLEGDLTCGTTNIDFSKGLFDSIQQMRGYRKTRLSIGKETVELETDGQRSLEKKVKVPDSWIRAFLQVQSAATLPHTSFTIAPIDFYNVLRHLRFHVDQKGKGRGLRIELVPGDHPRLILEPWEEVFTTSAGIYRGKSSEVIRIWGRRRLMLVRRLLPFLESIDIHVIGSGMPSFVVFKAGPIKLTVGLSGWTANNWAQIVSFDLLLPRQRAAKDELEKVLTYLSEKYFATAEEIGNVIGVNDSRLLAALQLGCQQGSLMYDIDNGVYRYRALTEHPLDWDRLEFRNDNERVAYDHLAKEAVTLESENRVHSKGIEVIGQLHVEAEQRDYRVEFVITPIGFLTRVKCTCRMFRTHRLKNGPCSHIVALRLWYAREEARRRELASKGGLRETVTNETKTYAKRHDRGEEVYQLSLNQQRLKLRWGQRGTQLRVQSLVFNSLEEARQAYYLKVDGLESKGYLDATEGGVA